jgi:integrase
MTSDTNHEATTYAAFVTATGWPHNGRRGEPTIDRLERSIRPFLDRYGDRPIRDGITSAAARAFTHTYGPDCAEAACTLLNDLRPLTLCQHNPFAGSMGTPPAGENETLTDADFADLIRLAEDVWRGQSGRVLAALIQTLGEEGLRLGEALTLRRADLDFDHDTLTVWASIDRDRRIRPLVMGPRIIRMFPQTKRRLRELAPDGSDAIFRNHAGRPLGRHGLRYRWPTIAAAWQATRPDDHWIHDRLGRDPRSHLSLYELRRRAARWLMTAPPHGAGYSPIQAAVHLGLSSPMLPKTTHLHGS